MDRRTFLLQTAAGSSALTTLAGCGGGSETEAGTHSEAAGAAQPTAAPLEPTAGTTGGGSLEQALSLPPPAGNAPMGDSLVRAGTALMPFYSWDAGSGPTRDMWSAKLWMKWANKNVGDWLDANGTPQGTVPHASATVSGGPVSWDVTALVGRWVSSGLNRGFYLRSSQAWNITFAGRLSDEAAKRPQLTVVTDQGSFQAPCVCNATWTPSSAYSIDSRKSFSVAKGSYYSIVQFDLSGVRGRVTSARMTLTCTGLRYAGVVDLMELNPPAFRDGTGSGEGLPLQLGIAQDYPFDRGIAANPDVLFATDFKVMNLGTNVAAGSEQVLDPASGTTYLRGLIPKGQLLGADLVRNVVGADASGVPNKVEPELYMRYMVYLEEDWGSTVDANKMPGLDGRFGWWNPVGYWQGTTGSGGTRPTGLKVRNAKGRWEYQGASMRGHGGNRAGDGNPYDDHFWIGSYIYHLDQATQFGESCRWGNTVLAKKRWYSIEQYMKMNTITGPYDAHGNGTAVADGVYKVWVDGVLAFERTGFRWRRHPEMGVQGAWFNWYHGGTLPSPSTMHFRMNSVVLARKYIGPRNDGELNPNPWPAWRRAIASRCWGIVTTHKLAQIDPTLGATDIAPPGADWVDRTMTLGLLSWCGGTWDDAKSRFMIPVGGGHTDYGGNEPYRLDVNVDSPRWVMVRPPSGAVPPGPPLVTRDGQEYTGLYSDGRIRAQHTYNNCISIPGHGPLITRGSGMHYTGNGTIRRIYEVNEDSGEATMVLDYSTSVANPGGSIGMAAWDPDRQRLWITGRGTSQGLLEVNPSNWSVIQRGTHTITSGSEALHYCNSIQALAFVLRGLEVRTWRIGAGIYTYDKPAVSGSLSAGFAPRSNTDGYGSCWCEDLNAIALYQQVSHTTEISLLTPTGAANSPWVRSVLAVSSSNTVIPPASPADGLFNRFWYSKKYHGFFVVFGTQQNVYFFAL